MKDTKKSTRRLGLNQKDKIIDHLENDGYLTAGTALIVHGVFRLAARIRELRQEGYNIKTEMAVDANGKRYARYYL